MISRRHVLAGAAALFAGAAGVLTARFRRGPEVLASDALERLLTLPLTDLQGGALQIGAWRGHPILVNFWATWCPPCIEEIPGFIRLKAAHPELRILGIAVDKEDNVRQFAANLNFNYPIALASSAALSLLADLGNPGRALPFTVLLDADARMIQRRLGTLSEGEARTLIGLQP